MMAVDNEFPWHCVGDFNEVGSIWEKQGGKVCNKSRIEQYQQLLSNCALMDLEFKGYVYTWSNKQGKGGNIRERLDKAYASMEWRLIFPYAQIFHELVIGLDHSPIIIDCCIPPKRVPYSSKSESLWCTHDSRHDVIASSWNQSCRGSHMYRLT
ncbi:hypothetical protein Vadar_021979 [Vaccinium darrowii]|uniref:Uncharacterized protein n=1 Tax=Vaccinium darrowii TaxID=229202 RepID=A0ACB7XBC5_9ERIC|nr:hypothetical protein Vadar_021979 [Vaccinium darrowii]